MRISSRTSASPFTLASASAPFSADTISWPSATRMSVTTATIDGSSSTTRIRLRTWSPPERPPGTCSRRLGHHGDLAPLIAVAASDLARELDQVDRLALANELALLEPRGVEQLQDERGQPPALADDPLQAGKVSRRQRLRLGTPLQEL